MTDFLYAQPSLLSGMARVGDLAGLFDGYNLSPTPEASDARAIHSDWRSVGRDILGAMHSFTVPKMP